MRIIIGSWIIIISLSGYSFARDEMGISLATGKIDKELASNLERYSDLLGDPDSARFLNIFLDPAMQSSGTLHSKEAEEELLWIYEQSHKLFPIAVEIFKREDSISGVNMRIYSMNYTSNRHGDRNDMLQAIREELPKWGNYGYGENHNVYVVFTMRAVEFIANHGEEKDREVLEIFAHDQNRGVQDAARRGLEKFAKRMEKIRENKLIEHERAARRSSREVDGGQKVSGNSSKWIANSGVITFGSLIFMVLLFFAVKKLSKTSG